MKHHHYHPSSSSIFLSSFLSVFILGIFSSSFFVSGAIQEPPFTILPPNYVVVPRKIDPELNYHRVLATTIWSSTDDIRRNFRMMARIYYGTDEFHTMTDALTVLTDPRQRKLYEKGGFAALWGYEDPKFEDELRDSFEINSEFATGSFSLKFGTKEGEEKKSPSVTHQIKLPLEQFITGQTFTVAIMRKEICPICNGTGGAVASELLKCPVCDGKKTQSTHAHLGHGKWKQTLTRACKNCDGTGQVATVPCPHCHGARVVDGKKEISITVEPGTPEGHPYEFIGEAEQVPGAAAGNVILTVSSKPHPLFQREGSDLVCERNITLMQALMGFEMPIQTIDGRTILMRRDEMSKPGTVHEIPDEGMPVYQVPNEKGKMKIKLNIVFPERIAITDDKKQALRTAEDAKLKKKKKIVKDDGTEEEIEVDDEEPTSPPPPASDNNNDNNNTDSNSSPPPPPSTDSNNNNNNEPHREPKTEL